MLKMIGSFSLSVFIIFLSCASFANSERGTRQEAVAMVKRVQQMYSQEGADKTFSAVTTQNPVFKDRDLYPFIYDLEGLNVAHGVKEVLVGKDLYELRDGEGTPLIQLMIKAAKSTGSGWVDYKWPNPVTGKLTAKSAYIEKLGPNYFVGVGVYAGN